MEWETVIGLEVHVQLATRTKIFSGASTRFGAPPNTQACAIDLAMPGTLPVLNAEALRMAVKFGLAIGADIAEISVFDRKNYFYPDLPKGYQISQLDHPIVSRGAVRIDLPDGSSKTIAVTRAHLDARNVGPVAGKALCRLKREIQVRVVVLVHASFENAGYHDTVGTWDQRARRRVHVESGSAEQNNRVAGESVEFRRQQLAEHRTRQRHAVTLEREVAKDGVFANGGDLVTRLTGWHDANHLRANHVPAKVAHQPLRLHERRGFDHSG